jgi:hypothetical protein
LLDFSSEEEREDYSQRILQRVGINVSEYAILNIHRIGVEAPLVHVFEELLKWDADSIWWPNHLATATRVEGGLEHLAVKVFGHGRKGVSLIELNAMRILDRPNPDSDNARSLLYECSGGYPIGVFAIYVRSPIAALDETETTQVLFAVSFDFYGKKDWSRANPVNKVWEVIHNRATANILNRLKRFCEWRFQRISRGL